MAVRPVVEASNIPVPDPSVLTTENLRREVAALRELIETRLAGMDHAREKVEAHIADLPARMNREMTRLQAMEDIKTGALEQRFADADLRYKERFDAADLRYQQRYDASDKALTAASLAAQGAVNAALAAAKEAVMAASVSAEKSVAAQNESNAASIQKSEMSVTKQIDSIMTLLTTSAKTLDEKIAGLNSRLDRGEGNLSGAQHHRTETRLDLGAILGAGAFIVAAIAVTVTIVNTHSVPVPPAFPPYQTAVPVVPVPAAKP